MYFRTRTLALLLACALTHTTQAAEPAATTTIPWTEAQTQATGVRTQRLGTASISADSGLVLQGTVELPPQATELLSTPLVGVVQQVLVSPGQQVKAGEPVARLLSPELLTWQRELLQAQSQARLTATRLKRDEQLHAEGIIPGLRLQDSRAQNEQAQLAVQERRQALQSLGLAGAAPAAGAMQAQMTLRAAAPGTVLEVAAVPGQRLDAGMPIARIARGGQLVIVLQATPEQARSLRAGDTLTLPGCQAKARLTAIVPQLSRSNQAVQVRADWRADPAQPEDCLRVQQYVQATVTPRASSGAPSAAITVPSQAVVRQAQQSYVFVRRAEGFAPTPVALGTADGVQVRVNKGLQAGDEIAVSGIAALKGAWLGLGVESKGQ